MGYPGDPVRCGGDAQAERDEDEKEWAENPDNPNHVPAGTYVPPNNGGIYGWK